MQVSSAVESEGDMAGEALSLWSDLATQYDAFRGDCAAVMGLKDCEEPSSQNGQLPRSTSHQICPTFSLSRCTQCKTNDKQYLRITPAIFRLFIHRISEEVGFVLQ